LRDTQSDLQYLLTICSELNYSEDQVRALLAATAESYQGDGGQSLIAEAFAS
jgi:hypothetical protein